MTVTTRQASNDVKCDDPQRVSSSAITTVGGMIMVMIKTMDIASSLVFFFFPNMTDSKKFVLLNLPSSDNIHRGSFLLFYMFF